jgi:phage protein D
MATDTGPWFRMGFPEGSISDESVRLINRRLLSMEFQDREKKVDKAKIVFDNRDRALFDAPIFRVGTILTLQWGYLDRAAPERRLLVTAANGWSKLTIEAKSPAILMAVNRHSRGFDNSTYAEAVEEIAASNGFSGTGVTIQVPEDDKRDDIRQMRESDAAFLARTARKFGFEFWIGPAGLYWGERQLEYIPTRVIRYGDQKGAPGNVIGDPVVKSSLLGLHSTVKVKAPDEKGSKKSSTKNDKTDKDRAGLAPVNPLSETRDTSTDTVPKTTLAGAIHSAASRAGNSVSGLGTSLVKYMTTGELPENRVAGTDTEHDPDGNPARRAKARYRKGIRRAVKMTCRIVGDPTVSAKSVVILEGFAARLDGRYWVQECLHSIPGRGAYTTELVLISDGHSGHSTKGDARFDLGRLASAGKRGAGGSGARGGVEGDLVKQRIQALSRATNLRTFGPGGAPFIAIDSRVTYIKKDYNQRGKDAYPNVRTVAGEAQQTGASQGDAAVVNAANDLIAALDLATRSEEPSNARLNKGAPAQEGSVVEVPVTSPEGLAAVGYRNRNTHRDPPAK